MTGENTYTFIYFGPGIPSVLTVIFQDWKTVALGGNSFGALRSSSGPAEMVRLQYANGTWSLGITTETGEISVVGNTRPEFADNTI